MKALRGTDKGNHGGDVGVEGRHPGAPYILKLPEVRGRRGGTEDRAGTSYGRELGDLGEHPAEVMERYGGQDGQEATIGFVAGGHRE